MPSDIFLFLAIWLAERACSFLRYLDRCPKQLFFSDKPRSENNFRTQNTTPKIEKSTLSIPKIVKYSELSSMDLVPSPKYTFVRPKCEKRTTNIEKTLPSAICVLIQMRHIQLFFKTFTHKNVQEMYWA
jgi:hypothetical protein